jgi:hypothetical protein
LLAVGLSRLGLTLRGELERLGEDGNLALTTALFGDTHRAAAVAFGEPLRAGSTFFPALTVLTVDNAVLFSLPPSALLDALLDDALRGLMGEESSCRLMEAARDGEPGGTVEECAVLGEDGAFIGDDDGDLLLD